MWALVVVMVDPVIQPLACIGERCKDRLAQELPPERLPEAFDLAQRHRMLRRTTHVADPLLLQNLLETALPAPGYELPAIVREDLPRSTPLAKSALDHLEHGVGALLTE